MLRLLLLMALLVGGSFFAYWAVVDHMVPEAERQGEKRELHARVLVEEVFRIHQFPATVIPDGRVYLTPIPESAELDR